MRLSTLGRRTAWCELALPTPKPPSYLRVSGSPELLCVERHMLMAPGCAVLAAPQSHNDENLRPDHVRALRQGPECWLRAHFFQ